MFEVEPTGASSGFCDCCGSRSHTICGFVRKGERAVASYFFQWTVGKCFKDHPANFDLIYGLWGENAKRADRRAISLVYFENANGPGVSVIDATNRPVANSELVGSALTRDEVLAADLSKEVFAIFDAVIVQDHRLK
jgi:hypothetical protein